MKIGKDRGKIMDLSTTLAALIQQASEQGMAEMIPSWATTKAKLAVASAEASVVELDLAQSTKAGVAKTLSQNASGAKEVLKSATSTLDTTLVSASEELANAGA